MNKKLILWDGILDQAQSKILDINQVKIIRSIFEACMRYKEDLEGWIISPRDILKIEETAERAKAISSFFDFENKRRIFSHFDQRILRLCIRNLRDLSKDLFQGKEENLEKIFSNLPPSVKVVICENLSMLISKKEYSYEEGLQYFLGIDNKLCSSLDKYKAIFHGMTGDGAFELAAVVGDLECLKYYFDKGLPLQKESYSVALEEVAERSDIKLLKFFKEYSSKFDQYLVNNLVVRVSTFGYVEVLQILFSFSCVFTKDTLKMAIINAVEAKRIRCFEILIDKFMETVKQQSNLSGSKLRDLYEDELSFLYSYNCKLLSIDFFYCLANFNINLNATQEQVVKAIKDNDRTVLDYLVPYISRISTSFDCALTYAIENDAPDVIPAIVSRISFCRENKYKTAISEAIRENRVLMLEKLLTDDLMKMLGESYIQSMIVLASEDSILVKPTYESLKFLLARYPILHSTIEHLKKHPRCDWNALQPMIEQSYAVESIPESSHDALLELVEKGDVASVKKLLEKDVYIPSYFFMEILKIAVRNGSLYFLRLFLEGQHSREICNITKKTLIKRAYQLHENSNYTDTVYKQCADFLLSIPSCDEDVALLKTEEDSANLCLIRNPVMTISYDDLLKDPKGILKKLIRNGLPRFFDVNVKCLHRYLNQNNEFITHEVLKCNNTQIYEDLLIMFQGKGLLPNYLGIPFVRPKDDETLEIFHMLGKFYCDFFMMTQAIDHRIVTGAIFSRDFFTLLQTIIPFYESQCSRSDLDCALLEMLCTIDSPWKDVFLYLNNPKDELYFHKILDSFKYEIVNFASAREFAENVFMSIKSPLIAFIEGARATEIHACLFTAIMYESAEAVCEKIQGGKITKERIIAAFTPMTQNPELLEKIEWIKESVQSAPEEINNTFFENIVRVFSGSSTIKKDIRFFISLRKRRSDAQLQSLFQMDVISSKLNILEGHMEKNEFIQAFKDFIKNNLMIRNNWRFLSTVDSLPFNDRPPSPDLFDGPPERQLENRLLGPIAGARRRNALHGKS